MWQPLNIGLPVAVAMGGVIAFLLAVLLGRVAWVLPGRIDPQLGERHSRHHFRIRMAFPGLAPFIAATCLWCFGVTPAAFAALVYVLVLLMLAWIDAETGLLPDALTQPLLWLGLLVNLRHGFAALPDAVLGAAAGYLVLWSVYWGFRLCTGREGMGHGDFKLLAAVGAWLGWAALPWVLLVASAGGLAAALVLRWVGRWKSGEPISFGPCIAGAGVAGIM